MAQINLLKQTAPQRNLWTVIPKFFASVLLVVLIILVLYYGWLIIESKKVASNIINVQAQINEEKKIGLNMPKRDEVLVRQQQLQGINEAVGNHLYWTQLLPELARVTLKSASYSNIKVGTDGKISMTVKVPTIGDLDKYLQVFDLPAFNKNFSDVRIGGYYKVQSEDNSSTINFDVMMKYNPDVIQYKPDSE